MQPSDYTSVVEKLYLAYFGRPAEPGGLQYWSQMLADAGAPTTADAFFAASGSGIAHDVLAGFAASPESQALYGSSSVESQVVQIYQNVLGRSAEPAGLAAWSQLIKSGQLSLASASFAILKTAEQDTNGDARGVAAKVAVASAYTASIDTPAEISAFSGNAAAANARALLATVTRDTSAASFQASIDASIKALPAATPAPAPAPAPSPSPAPATPPKLAITSSSQILQSGDTATISFTFTKDPGTSFTDSDITTTGGTLSALSGTGLVRTATFTANGGNSLSSGGHITVQPSSFTDSNGTPGDATTTPTLALNTVFNKVLFVGNSATFARIDPVMRYDTWNATTNPGGVHDLTSPDRGGTFSNLNGSNLYEPHNWGGVPGLVDRFADQVGLSYDVSISARNAATLKGQYTNSSPAGWDMRGNIASQKWDMVVLQDQTDEPLPGGKGSITFAAGSSTATLVVTPTADAVKEYDETLALTLASGTGYRVGTTGAITTTILDDDSTPPTTNPALSTVTLTANPGSVLEDGNNNLVFTFTRTGDTASDLAVSFTIFRDGSTAPSVSTSDLSSQDLEMYKTGTGALSSTGSGASPYRFSSGGGFATSSDTGAPTTTGSISFGNNTGTIVIKAGQASASITLDPHADSTVEADESVRLALSHPTSGTDYNIGTIGNVTGTIVNDDFAAGTDTSLPNVTLGLGSAAGVYEDSGGRLVYTFTRSGDTSAPLTVNFTEDGTASYFAGSAANSDFGISTTGTTGTTTLTATSSKNADLASFQKYANLIESYIHTGAADTTTTPGTTIAANPNADASTDVYLYATWARPDMVAGAYDMVTNSNTLPSGADNGTGAITRTATQATGYYLNIADMTNDLQNAYANLAATNTAFKGVAPVGMAFLQAVQGNLAVANPYTDAFTTTVANGGKLDLWFDDNLHASKYGSYLSGLTLFQTLTGLDAQVLGAADLVASDLGIDAATAVALQKVASATMGFDASLRWTGSPGTVKDLGGANTNVVLATAGGFSFNDNVNTAHTVSVQAAGAAVGTLTAAIRSDGTAGQVNWVYKVNDQVLDPLLATGAQRSDSFVVTVDDGHGHTTSETVAVKLVGV